MLESNLLPAILTLLVVSSLAQDLEFVTTNTRLSPGRYQAQVAFDGQDSIYSVGGLIKKIGELPHFTLDVLRYSVSDETLDLVDKMVRNAKQGSAVWAGNDTLYYFGGEVHQELAVSEVWRLPTSGPKNMSVSGHLPVPIRLSAAVWDGGDSAYVIGGQDDSGAEGLDTIFRYSISEGVVGQAGQLPGGRRLSSAVFDPATGLIYILGGYESTSPPYGYDEILVFDPAQGTVSTLEAKLPTAVWNSCALWTGTEVYLVAGNTADTAKELIRFNPSTNEVVSIPVRNMPKDLSGVGCAFVERLNRIYVIGGFNFESGSLNYWDTISYIQL